MALGLQYPTTTENCKTLYQNSSVHLFIYNLRHIDYWKYSSCMIMNDFLKHENAIETEVNGLAESQF